MAGLGGGAWLTSRTPRNLRGAALNGLVILVSSVLILAGVGAGFLLTAGGRLQSLDALPELHPAALWMALVTLAGTAGPTAKPKSNLPASMVW